MESDLKIYNGITFENILWNHIRKYIMESDLKILNESRFENI